MMDHTDHEMRNSISGIEFLLRQMRQCMGSVEKYLKRMDKAVAKKRAEMENQIQLVRSTLQGEIRVDPEGDGHFGASRGKHTHEGVDYVVTHHDPVFAIMDGKITRFGYPYDGNIEYRLCEIVSGHVEAKLMYLHPFPYLLGEEVRQGQIIGAAQSISLKYTKDMIDHIHTEVRVNGRLVDPEEYMI